MCLVGKPQSAICILLRHAVRWEYITQELRFYGWLWFRLRRNLKCLKRRTDNTTNRMGGIIYEQMICRKKFLKVGEDNKTDMTLLFKARAVSNFSINWFTIEENLFKNCTVEQD